MDQLFCYQAEVATSDDLKGMHQPQQTVHPESTPRKMKARQFFLKSKSPLFYW
jgi:hypothetical protein